MSDNGDLVLINNNFRSCLGYNADEPLSLNGILVAGSNIFFQVHLLPLIKLQNKASEVFLSFKTKSGTSIPVLLNAVRVCDEDFYKIHFAGIEISQRNKYETEILQARDAAEKALLENADIVRLKNELDLSQSIIEQQLQQIERFTVQHKQINKVLSHDLQEPLRKISVFASLINKFDLDVELNLSKILKSAKRLQNLLSRMQRLHAIDHGKFERKSINLNTVLEKAKEKLLDKEISFTIITKDLLELRADYNQLVNLFVELLDNSLKFRKTDIPVEIKIVTNQFRHNVFIETENRFQYEEYIRIIYTDNGLGFENEYAAQAFDLFSKLHPNEGLGIGLTYVKRIVDLHKGIISLKSKKGTGVEITILLPL